MNIKELKDAIQVAIDAGLPLSAPVYVENIDESLDDIRDVVSSQSSLTILLEE